MKVKLGPQANIFYDPVTKVLIHRGDVVELNVPQRNSEKTREALKGMHLVQVKEEIPVAPIEEVKPWEKSEEELLDLTRQEIMESFPFLDEEDLSEANKKKTKKDLVEFLKECIEDYEL